MSAVTVGGLLDEKLTIPHYQRPYTWEPGTALRLVDDIQQALDDSSRPQSPYVLGAVILFSKGEVLEVVDGQQRLLTLRMILAILDPKDDFSLASGLGSPVGLAWQALKRRLAPLDDDCAKSLADYVRGRCSLVRIVTEDPDEAFRVFDSQNYRGRPLAPHDLLKAHHLREMRDESESSKVAVVEAWESVRDEDLDRLFSTYLYRIVRWSRGESALGFTTRDIDVFKGITPRPPLTPNTRYHLAAHAAVPMLSAWGGETVLRGRDAGRSRFQFDAPLPAGRGFFEMVAFMLAELAELAKEAFTGGKESFSAYDGELLTTDEILQERPSQSRYRYVTELYLAALLYYTNKFGDEYLEEAKDALFAWAYALRVELLRVQFRSIDRLARGDKDTASAFVLLRNAGSGRTVEGLSATARPYTENHEPGLVRYLELRGAR